MESVVLIHVGSAHNIILTYPTFVSWRDLKTDLYLCPWRRRLPSPYWLYYHHALVSMERLHGVHFSEQIGLLAKVRGVCTAQFTGKCP